MSPNTPALFSTPATPASFPLPPDFSGAEEDVGADATAYIIISTRKRNNEREQIREKQLAAPMCTSPSWEYVAGKNAYLGPFRPRLVVVCRPHSLEVPQFVLKCTRIHVFHHIHDPNSS